MEFHALRVTFGTNLVLAGVPIRVVQELMRHSDIRLTMKIYTDASKLPLKEGIAALPWVGVSVSLGVPPSNSILETGRKLSDVWHDGQPARLAGNAM